MGDSQAARPGQVLIVEDDAPLARAIERALQRRGHQAEAVSTAAATRAFLERKLPELVLLDLNLPDESGLSLLPEIKGADELVSVVVITGDREVSTVVEAMKRGADNFLPKPFDLARLVEQVERSLDDHRVRRRASVYRVRVGEPDEQGVLPDLVGSSEPIGAVRELVAQVAGTDASVLLLGETGTGKGMVARGIHRLSRRAAGSFVEVNCASIQPQLLESEIFGYEKGAFTGATGRKPGLMEVADGGTLFLDEIAEMESASQSKLLTALENRTFRRVGGVREISVDVRLVAATHHDLEEEVADKRFRADLYYRLNVFQIALPPLRERLSDLPELVDHFVRVLNPVLGREVKRVSPKVYTRLADYPWPGNVRELRNLLERAMILTRGDTVELEHLAGGLRRAAQAPAGGVRTLEEVEREHIERVLEAVGFNRQRAAKELGISRSTLYAKIERYRLRAAGDEE